MYIIAGLGNPGGKYEKTKHNMGFQVIDLLADKYHIEMNQKKHKAICGTGIIEGVKVLLLKPQTFMNLSGESIRDAVDFYKIDPETELIVIYDDISLPPGHLRSEKKEVQEDTTALKILFSIWGLRYSRGSVWVWERSRKDGIWQTMY